MDLKQPATWFSEAKDKPQAPAKVVVVWSDAAMQHPDRRPTRGFGGRLMFYGPDGETAVRADGILTVYAFDEANRNPNNAKPDRKYVFTAEQFANHYSKSELGHSYSVWIPWDEAGGPKRQVGLICRFDPVDGPAVVSEQTLVTLPGKSEPVAARPSKTVSHVEHVASKTSPVQPVSYDSPIPRDHAANPPDADRKSTMKTTTIPIPPHFGRVTPVAQAQPRADKLLRTTRLPYVEPSMSKAGAAEPDKRSTAPSTDPIAQPPGPQTTDSRPAGFQAPAAPPAPRAPGHAPWQPLLGGSPPPQSLPPWATGSGANWTSPVGRPTSNRFEPMQVE